MPRSRSFGPLFKARAGPFQDELSDQKNQIHANNSGQAYCLICGTGRSICDITKVVITWCAPEGVPTCDIDHIGW